MTILRLYFGTILPRFSVWIFTFFWLLIFSLTFDILAKFIFSIRIMITIWIWISIIIKIIILIRILFSFMIRIYQGALSMNTLSPEWSQGLCISTGSYILKQYKNWSYKRNRVWYRHLFRGLRCYIRGTKERKVWWYAMDKHLDFWRTNCCI